MTTGVSSATGATGASLAVNGLISGITTPEVINALLKAYQEPITNLVEKQSTLNSEASDYRTLSTALQAVQTAAEALNTKSAWDLTTATSSNSQVATAVAAAGAQTGSLSFSVTQLAQANVLASSGGVASEAQVVTNAASMLVATGAAGIGFSALTGAAHTGSTALSIGAFTITVLQSSSAAKVIGSPLGAQVAVTAPATLSLEVNGADYTLTLALTSGEYSVTTLAAAVNSAASTPGGPAIVATVGATGGLVLSTDAQGGTASISVIGETGLTATGLAGKSATGSDAVITVGGTRTTVSSITAGSTVTLNGPAGVKIKATVSTTAGAGGALISAGSAKVANVSTGNGSLSAIVSAINASGLPATASAVELSSGDYILQLSANDTGTVGAVSVDAAAFTGSALGQLRTITAAKDATVTVGGTGGYTLRSSTDTFTSLLVGTSVTVAAKGTATITVTPDAAAEATRVGTLVTAANRALADIQAYAGYTTSSKKGGPLMGNAVISGIKNEILSIFASGSGTSTLGDLKNVGVSLQKTGTLSFTAKAFTAAFSTNPTQVTDLFVQGGTYTPSATANASDVSFAYATTATAAATYRVVISQSATQAVDSGSTLSNGTVSTGETLTVAIGTTRATYTTTAGQSLTSIANGLNEAFAGANLDLSVEVVTGTQLQIVSGDYGTAASFTVTSTASGTLSGTTGLGTTTRATFTGTNVAGTIGGLAATGDGQVLSLPPGSPGGGLGIEVTATGITAGATPVTLGTFAYRPGVGQQLVAAMSAATTSATGSVTSAIKSLTTEATGLDSQITMYERLETEQRTTLQKEFDTMETNLGKLQDESSELESQIAKLTVT